jgi:hypothetical protein
MKIPVVFFLLLTLAACDSNQASSPVTSSPSPSSAESVGPMSDQAPKPSPMASGSVATSPLAARSSSTSSPALTPSFLPSGLFPSTTASGLPSAASKSGASAQLPIAVPSAQATAKETKAAVTPGQPNVITTDSIGKARIGMTFGELKKTLGKGTTFEVTNNFAVDFSAIAVKKQGQVQFYIPYEQSTKLTDDSQIQYLVTDNPSYKTEQGVSPGMTIKQASQIYGAARLRLNREQESKEVVSFAQQPAQITFYGVLPGGKDFAGVYPDSNEPAALETDKYNDRAQIGKIIVACRPGVCAPEH